MIRKLISKFSIMGLLSLLILTSEVWGFEPFDTSPVWPLCGRIEENSPKGWNPSKGCPESRWGNPDYTDTPISSTFGPRQLASQNFRYDFHRGLDIATPTGTPLFALSDGIVQKAGVHSGYSDPLIQLRHYRPGTSSCSEGEGCYHTNYLHVLDWVVDINESVSKGQLIGYTGASGSGFQHVHFEIRDASINDIYSNWSRDAIHPLKVLMYNDTGASNIDLQIINVDTSNPNLPTIEAQITIPLSVELDLERIEVEAFTKQNDGTLVTIEQPGVLAWGYTIEGSGYWVNPPFYSMHDFNRQYSYKNSSSIPWASFLFDGAYESPYETQLPVSYNANIHLDAADPNDDQVGLFNGWSLAPNHTNANSEEYVLTVNSLAIVGTDNADDLCLQMRALDVHGNATNWQTWNCDDAMPEPPQPPSEDQCGDLICEVGESCDGRNQTLACPTDCDGKTKGKPSNRFCFVEGICEGPGCG